MMLVKLAAYFDADMHELFTGERYPMTNAEKERNAEFVAIFLKLMRTYQSEDISMIEAEQITLHYLRYNQRGDDHKDVDLDDSIRAKTGNKFVRGGPERSDREDEGHE